MNTDHRFELSVQRFLNKLCAWYLQCRDQN